MLVTLFLIQASSFIQGQATPYQIFFSELILINSGFEITYILSTEWKKCHAFTQ